ncbi:hypothetical protein K1719_017642 [Acacia pycnantha]|nr:hypothetical protein K1719_017642 [Acacia pycnantha]
MDPDIFSCILEFLLRSSVPDLLLKKVLKSLPLSRIDSRLWKTLALRSIQSEVAMASFTENSLECLEVIEEIDRLDGIAITQAMKEAYCAVAVECSVRHLGACPDKNTRGLFDDAVNRIWRGRVRQMMEAMALGRRSNLFTPELIGWKDLLESARWDAEVCGRLMNMSTRQNAIDEVRVYLKETWESMGPSFLELADILSQDEGLGSSRGDQMGDAELAANIPIEGCDRGVSESVLVSDQMNMCKEGLHCSTNTTQEGLVVSDGSALNNAAICMEKAPVAGGNQESEQLGKRVLPQRINEAIQKGKLPLECNHAVPSTRRGVKIIDAEEEGPAIVCGKDHNASNVKVEKLRKSLMSSSLELRALVKDPLPDALHKSDIEHGALSTYQ